MPFDRVPLRYTQAVLPLHEKHSLNQKAAEREWGVKNGETTREKQHRLRRKSGALLPKERVRKCGYQRHSPTVDIHRSKTGAHFVGLETCGSVWHCPVCAAKIAERRREDVAKCIDGAAEQGGATYMLTLTMRHAYGDKLEVLVEHIVNGWRKVQNRRAYRNLKEKYGVIGTVRAVEVTYGKNGWHPHLHILFVFNQSLSDLDRELVEGALFNIWTDVLAKSCGNMVSVDALDFRQATSSDYVTKWGADRELVKGQQKLGNNSRSPWQLQDSMDEDPRAGALFREYANVFKGKRQLTWSKGLKATFGVGDLEDEDAANEKTEADEELQLEDGLKEGRVGTLDSGTWSAIQRLKLSAKVLDAAHVAGWRGVTELLEQYKLVPYHDESVNWKQPPKGGRPMHPRRYMTLAADKFIYGNGEKNDHHDK